MEHEAEARSVAAALAEINDLIAAACDRAGRNRAEVEVIGVSKTFGPDVVNEAWQAGINLFGENRVQEAAAKIPQCASGPEWHLIGHLQRNKVHQALALFTTIHSVDSLRLIEAIDAAAAESGARPVILLEVNVSGESSKFGFKPAEAPAAVECALNCKGLTLAGLMTMAPFNSDPEATRPIFARLRQLQQRLEHDFQIGLPHLSMGMSNDFTAAILEGATWVRIGTKLFGGRPTMKEQLRQETAAQGGWDD